MILVHTRFLGALLTLYWTRAFLFHTLATTGGVDKLHLPDRLGVQIFSLWTRRPQNVAYIFWRIEVVWTNLDVQICLSIYPKSLPNNRSLRVYESTWTACWWSFDRRCGKLSLLQIYELMELFLIMINNESQKKPRVILRHMCLMSGVERVRTVVEEGKVSWQSVS